MDLEIAKGQLIKDNISKDELIKSQEEEIEQLKKRINDYDESEAYLRTIIDKREAEKKVTKK